MYRAILLAAFVFWHMNCTAAERWMFATGYSAESFHTKNLEQFAREVNEATGGKLQIIVAPNNTHLRLSEIFQGVQQLKAEGGEVILSLLIKDIPLTGADSVPFITKDYEDARRMWILQKPMLTRHFAARGLKLLYSVPWPPQGLYSRNPIKTAADLRGVRMRTYNSTTVAIARKLGAIPIDIPMVDVQKALAEGQIDSMITSAVTGVENRVWEHLRYYYDINAWIPKNVVFMNLQRFNAQPTAVRDLIERLADKAESRGWMMSQETARRSLEQLQMQGMKIERLPDQLDLRLLRAGESFAQQWVRQVGIEAHELFLPYFFKTDR